MMRVQPIKRTRPRAERRTILLAFATLALLAIACGGGGLLPDTPTPSSQPIPPGPPAETTDAPPEPPTAAPPVDPGSGIWNNINGMWSGCPADAGAGLFLDICPTDQTFPVGPFITLYLPPSCNVGEACGVYIKGAFSSEFIPFELTLEGYIQGRAQFHADSGTGMYEGLDRTLYIDLRQGQLNVEESTGETYMLSPGCNPVISDAFGCLDTMPG